MSNPRTKTNGKADLSNGKADLSTVSKVERLTAGKGDISPVQSVSAGDLSAGDPSAVKPDYKSIREAFARELSLLVRGKGKHTIGKQ